MLLPRHHIQRILKLTGLAVLLSASASHASQVRVEVEGDHSDLRDNARIFVGEVEGRSADGLRRYASTAIAQVEQAIRALGYYNPVITFEVTENADGLAELVLTVVPGEPVRIRSRSVLIEGPGSEDPVLVDQIPKEPAEGDVLHHGRYNTLRQAIQNRARRLGYFDGEFVTRRLEVDPSENYADITLHYRTGERYRLGAVTFLEGHGFDDGLLNQFVTFEPGIPFHADEVAKLNSDLSSSGYFSGVDIDASPNRAEDGVIPVDIGLTPRPPRSVGAGVGFSTDVGPRFRGNWREHYTNPMGHRRGADTELSELRQNVSGWYELPLDPPMTDSIRLGTGYQRENIEDVESERLTLGQQWRHQLDTGWMQVLSIRWEGERFKIGEDERGNSSLLLPGLSYSKLQANSPLDPSRGYRLQFDVTGAHRAIISDADILHVNVLARGLYTLADNHRFLTRFNFGGVATNSFSDVPPSLRFFAGGDQSVRGYGYETLSPRDDNGVAVGGRFQLVGGVEYQYEFVRNWRVAAFVDKGNAVNDVFDRLATGAGLGIRWVSPVGPLRLDLAKGLDEEFDGGWRIHFSMGPEL
ncbi:autotransporter assembly complex protein TamA [Marinobacter excellens]|jgi:translocation and assembly module TamA|uniref:Translocation and assembly module subunit TamA n=1 Tax=Marinobacter excellens LAMA 842 TaxID=1306954 RepID=A0A137SCS0_9GAMM|nr:autotransporter assembly complex family protein [Marinobacter excellens]KXO10198.1 Outer membrane protein [Marinobacter excellens LAMA 842]